MSVAPVGTMAVATGGGRRSTPPLEMEACAIRHQNGSEFERGSWGRPGVTGRGHSGDVCFVRSPDQRPLPGTPASREAKDKGSLSPAHWLTMSRQGSHEGKAGKGGIAVCNRTVTLQVCLKGRLTDEARRRIRWHKKNLFRDLVNTLEH